MLRAACVLLLLTLVTATVTAEEPAGRSTSPVRQRAGGVPPASLTELSDAESTAVAANGARKVEYQQPQWNQAPSLGSILTKMAIGTVFVIIACGGTLWYGRRWLQKTQGVMPVKGGELKLLESTRVGGHCFVHLLQVGNQRILAGTDRTGLQSLIPLPEGFGSVLDDAVSAPGREDIGVPVDAYFGANERGRVNKADVKPKVSALSVS